MNIFVLSKDVCECVQLYHNAHVVKMTLETAQMLSTNLRVLGYNKENLYKKTHVNHPCTKWVRSSRSNLNWTLSLFEALLGEYTYRFGKVHKTHELLGTIRRGVKQVHVPDAVVPFVQAMPDKYKCFLTVAAYRALYLGEKLWIKRKKKYYPVKWTNRPVPDFVEAHQQSLNKRRR